MDNSLYVAMSAAKQDIMRAAIIAQNVSNANTVGFKSDHAEFQPLFAHMKNAVSDTAYSQLQTLEVNTQRGTYNTTGLDMDISSRDGYWITVKLPDGSNGFVSTATTVKNRDGVLTTTQGLPVLGEGGEIKIPDGGSYHFAGNGDVMVRAANGTSDVIDRLKIADVQGKELMKGPFGILVMKDGDAKYATDTDSTILPGVLENSNVNSMVAMTESLEISKSYQDQINMIMAAKSLDKNANSLLKLN